MTRWRLALTAVLSLPACAALPDPEPAPSDTATVDTGPPPEPITPGTYPEQTLQVGGETRYYYLYVPATVTGPDQVAVLFDFHGTAGGGVLPEEAYGLQGARAAAAAQGFVLVRPRSRSSTEGGQPIYRWDQNPGDPERNLEFSLALLDELAGRLPIDTERVYAMGFSSGTNQVAMLAEVPDTPLSGMGYVGGGAWHTRSQPDVGRVYLATPTRDYMRDYHHTLVDQLDRASHWPGARYERLGNGGHELYDDMYAEMFTWFDAGIAPEVGGALGPGWAASDAPAALAASASEDGVWLAGLDVLGRWDGTTFHAADVIGTPHIAPGELTGVCVRGARGAAVGQGAVLWSDDGGQTFEHLDPVTEPGPRMFGYARWNGVACHDGGEVVAAGYWSAGRSVDGQDWTDVPLDAGGYRAQVATVAVSPDGEEAFGGYYRYLALGTLPAPWDRLGDASWILGLAPLPGGGWVAVGDQGTILRRGPQDRSWVVSSGPGPLDELSAVAFRDDGVGLAVGRAGVAWLSEDFGQTWADAHLGQHRLLAAVAFLPDGRALVTGPEGAWTYTP